MRFLHTADWHVGKGLQGRSRIAEHEEVLDEIVAAARDRKVDATLVAGDLFDSASPAAEAERVVYSTLLALAEIGSVVVVPGNHDNDGRLAAVRELLGRAGVHVVPYVRDEPVELISSTGEKALVTTIPWISQRYIVKAEHLMSLDAFELSGEFTARLVRIVDKATECFTPDTVNIVVAHLTITNGRIGGGERTAQTVMEYRIEPSAFPASAHYVALGHLHKAQSFPARCPVHYSGSPLHLDFSDDPEPRSVTIVEAAPRTPSKIEQVTLTSGRTLRTIEGTLEQLAAQADSVGDEWLRVRVKEPARTELGNEVRELFPNAVKVIIAASEEPSQPTTDRLQGTREPHELFTEYLEERGVEDPNLVSLFKELHDEVTA